MQSPLIIELQRYITPNRDARPCAIIVLIAEWNDGVQTIIASGQLNDHQNLIIGSAGTLRIGRKIRRQAMSAAVEEDRQRRRRAQKLHAARKEKATGEE